MLRNAFPAKHPIVFARSEPIIPPVQDQSLSAHPPQQTNKTGPGGKTGAPGEGGRFWVIGTILLALVPGDDIYTSSFALYVNFG